MDESPGGHIHACSDAHELYWKDAASATSFEGVSPEEIVAMFPTLDALHREIAIASIFDDEDMDCACEIDPEDGSTIRACHEHPEGGSPKSKATWAIQNFLKAVSN